MTIDLSHWQDSSALIDAIWEVRRGNRKELRADVVRLLEHGDPIVREEALSLLFVKWAEKALRERLLDLLASDPDFGVRSRAAGALGALSDKGTSREDVAVLQKIVLDRADDPLVRKAAYESLHMIVRGQSILLDDDIDLDEEVDLEWIKQL